MNKEFSKLCTPAKIYFVLAVIACVFALFSGMGVVAVIVKLFFAFIWTFVLSWLCEKGYKNLSWFLVLLPYVMILLMLVGLTSSSYVSYTRMLTPMNGAGQMMPMMGSGMMREGMDTKKQGMMKPM